MSVGSLLWRSPDEMDPSPSSTLLASLEQLRYPASEHLYAKSREKIFHLQRGMRFKFHKWLEEHFRKNGEGRDAAFLGLDPTQSFEVHTARIAYRWNPDGGVSPQLLIGLLQTTTRAVDPRDPQGPRMTFEGGSTIVADLRSQRICYCIRKHPSSSARLARQQQFALREFDSLHATYQGTRPLGKSGGPGGDEPFALIHRGQ